MASRDVGPERERARSRSGHRDRSAERSRWRDGESERGDKHKRRRDRQRRDTVGRGDDDVADRTGVSGEQPFPMNALGIQPLNPGQGLYAPVAPPITSTPGGVRHYESYRTPSAGGTSSSYPATGHGTAPPISTTTSGSGMRHREVPHQIYGAGPSHAPRPDVYRPSSTPTGPVLSSWAAPDPSNPSLNSLGLSAPGQDVNGANPQMLPIATRDSVSSWGTADSGQTNGDLFSTLRPLASAPADNGLPAGDLLQIRDGQLLGVVRCTFLPPCYVHSLVFSYRAALRKLRVRDPSFHRFQHSQPLSVPQIAILTPARAPVTPTMDAPAHKHRLSPPATPPSPRHHNPLRLRIAVSLMLLYLPACRAAPLRSLFQSLTSRLGQPPRLLVLRLLTPCRWFRRHSLKSQLRSQLLQFHVRLRITHSSMAFLPRNHRILSIAHTTSIDDAIPVTHSRENARQRLFPSCIRFLDKILFLFRP